MVLMLLAFFGPQIALAGHASAAEAEGGAAATRAASPETPPAPAPVGDCERLVKLFDQQREQMASDLGRVKREMAALREEFSRPGLRDIVAGIGYIFGLAGIVLFFQSRGSRKDRGGGGSRN